MSCLFLNNFLSGMTYDPKKYDLVRPGRSSSSVASTATSTPTSLGASVRVCIGDTAHPASLVESKTPMAAVISGAGATGSVHTAGGAIVKKADDVAEGILELFVKRLIDQGVRMVCFDFDETMVNAVFNDEFKDEYVIREYISPLFARLAKLLLQHKIEVAIVTFNTNPHIERAVFLLLNYPVRVFAGDHSQSGHGKLLHLAQAMRHYNAKTGGRVRLEPHQVLLVDDDPVNAAIALEKKFHCINNPTVISLADLVKYIENSPARRHMLEEVDMY